MEWVNIIGSLIAALLFAIGLSLALRKRNQTAPQKMREFFEHLQKMGVKASLVEQDAAEEKTGTRRGSVQRSEGLIEIKDRKIDCINVVSVASQYSVNYYLDFLVRRPDWIAQQKRKKTRMVRKRSSAIGGKIVDIQWKGDDHLSRELNLDYRLKERLLQSEPAELKGGIQIYPEPKHEYSRVRTAYLLPSPDFLEAIDIIAGHVKGGW